MVKSILIPDAIVRPQDQARLPSLRVAPKRAPTLEAVHSIGSRFVLLESLPGMIATMPRRRFVKQASVGAEKVLTG